MASATAQKAMERVVGRAMGSGCVAEWLSGRATLLPSASGHPKSSSDWRRG